MARPRNCRRVGFMPECNFFKPQGIPMRELDVVALTLDELEAIRLADVKGMYQEEAAALMNVSRQTFGRIVDAAHKKIGEALITGKALQIEGGEIKMTGKRTFTCADCDHSWEVAYGTGRPQSCPKCESKNIHRSDSDRGGRCNGRGPRPGCRRSGQRQTARGKA